MTQILVKPALSWINIAEDICKYIDNCKLTVINNKTIPIVDQIVESIIKDPNVIYIGDLMNMKTISMLEKIKAKNAILWVDETRIPKTKYSLKNLTYNYWIVPVSQWNREVYEEHVEHTEEIIPRCTEFKRTKEKKHKNILFGVVSFTPGIHKRYEELLLAVDYYRKNYDELEIYTYGHTEGLPSFPYIHNTGQIGKSEIQKLYSIADFSIQLGIEAFGMPSIEAWATGTPMLHGNVNDVRNHAYGIQVDPVDFDVIDFGEYLLPIPIYDEYQLAEKMREITKIKEVPELPQQYRCNNVSEKLISYLST